MKYSSYAFRELRDKRELDWAIELEDGCRIRVNAYYQQDSIALALRLLPNSFFTLKQL